MTLIMRENLGEVLDLGGLHMAVLQIGSSPSFIDQLALTKREAIDQPDCSGRTALSWAAELGDIDQIQRLLRKGADPNAADCRGSTPFIHCAQNVECITELVQAGAHVNHFDINSFTKLHRLIINENDTNCFETLWNVGLDLNFGINTSSLAIFYTVERDRPRTLKWLLDHGVNLEVRDSEGLTPLLTFLSCTRDEVPHQLDILLARKPDYSVKDSSEEGVLHYVARYSGFQYMHIFKQKADLSQLDPEQRSIFGFKKI